MKLKKNGQRTKADNKLKTKQNWWKWLFLLLLALNVALIAVVASRIIQVREPDAENVTSTTSDEDIKVGTFSTNREQLNSTIAAYLKDYQTDKMTYTVYATSSGILFEGTYTLLGYEVPLYVYFEPSRLDSGSVQLTITSISAGTLPLPEEQVLQYIKSSYDLPDFVEVLPEVSAININLQNLENSADIYLKASTIDLVNDQFTFDIYKRNS